MRSKRHIIVVGSGIVGAAIAYNLSAYGASVTIIDKESGPPLATAASFAWINGAHGNPRPYYNFRLQSMLEWRALQEEFEGRLPLKWGGSIEWHATPGTLRAAVEEHESWGYPLRLLERHEIAALEPGIAAPPEEAAFSALEGSIEPIETTSLLVAAAEERGVRVIKGERALLTTRGDQTELMTEPGGDKIEADTIVLAAGADTEQLANAIGVAVPMANKPGLVIHCKPAEPLIGRVILSPDAHFKQDPNGRIVAAEDFGGGPVANDRQAEGERILARVKRRLKGADQLQIDEVTVGMRPIPADGLPILGRPQEMGNLYVAVMHSGVTLAPLIGRLAAAEIMDDLSLDVLTPYRPSRFGEKSQDFRHDDLRVTR